jgi:hypothetical protein
MCLMRQKTTPCNGRRSAGIGRQIRGGRQQHGPISGAATIFAASVLRLGWNTERPPIPGMGLTMNGENDAYDRADRS